MSKGQSKEPKAFGIHGSSQRAQGPMRRHWLKPMIAIAPRLSAPKKPARCSVTPLFRLSLDHRSHWDWAMAESPAPAEAYNQSASRFQLPPESASTAAKL